MNPIPVILDCDPGVDDAITFLLAKQLPELNVLAITSVAGNVALDYTTYNQKRAFPRSLLRKKVR